LFGKLLTRDLPHKLAAARQHFANHRSTALVLKLGGDQVAHSRPIRPFFRRQAQLAGCFCRRLAKVTGNTPNSSTLRDDSCRDCLLAIHSAPDCFEVDRKSTRLNSSHVAISYAVFCLKKKNNWNRDAHL